MGRESSRIQEEDERLQRDQSRALALIDDARAQIERLQGLMLTETETETDQNSIDQEADLKAQFVAAQSELNAAESNFEALSKLYHSAQERVRSDAIRLTEATNRLERMTATLREVESQKQALEVHDEIHLRLSSDARLIEALKADIQSLTHAQETSEACGNSLEADLGSAKRHLAEKTNAKGALEAEMMGLKRLLDAGRRDQKPILDLIDVQKGYELALASALGDDLNWGLGHSEDTQLIGFWNEDLSQETLNGFFETWGIASLESQIKAYPAVLKARLCATGLVSAEQGDRLQSQLPMGVRLVSRDGDLWRWDGLCIRARAPKPSAIRLAQRNRLNDIAETLKSFDADLIEAQQDLDAKNAQHAHWLSERERIKKQRQETEKALRTKTLAYDQTFAEATRQQARLEAINDHLTRLSKEHAHIYEQWQNVHPLKSDSNEIVPTEDQLTEAKRKFKLAQEISHEARSKLDWFHKEKDSKINRKRQWMSELSQWLNRMQAAESEQKRMILEQAQLKQRAKDYSQKQSDLSPQEVAMDIDKSLTQERLHKARTASEEHKFALNQALSILRSCEKEANAAKEALNTTSVKSTALKEALREMEKIIHFETKSTPEELKAELKNTTHAVPSSLSGLEALIEGLKAQREQMGSVNLRAEDDVKEAQNALGLLTNERNDLLVAIKKLRDAIEALNSEGRTKLLAAFDIINDHFKTLFVTLFGGGTASLALVESEDPLKAGLEIFACPPGKRLSTISLMSGGEQALTATALIFAVFLANPAPVCVLDEVDAPLDDANVERYCALLNAMRQKTTTRFLVITHNPVTMSKMDRLFGVTMAESGVSQLLSLRLEAAQTLIEENQPQAETKQTMISEAV